LHEVGIIHKRPIPSSQPVERLQNPRPTPIRNQLAEIVNSAWAALKWLGWLFLQIWPW
jgi:hypothetical protein